MDFGKVPEKQLAGIDFSLPVDPGTNRAVLPPFLKMPLIKIGCARWTSKQWVGKIYPKGARASQFLEYYMRNFNAIELNATYHNVLSAEAISKWALQARGRDFTFCPKFPKLISHESGFREIEQVTEDFLEGILAFGQNLGPVFLQISEYDRPLQRDKLFDYLGTLPRGFQFFLEVRHPAWFADHALRKELFDTLRSLNVGAVITDTAGRRDCAHMELTIPKTFIRFVGNKLHATDYTRIDAWVSRLKDWSLQGVQEIYFFMHDEDYSPELTVYLVDKINAACGTNLPKPQFLQGSLFSQFGLSGMG
jgi:uncharacterized protein YecE (DUF72 family)